MTRAFDLTLDCRDAAAVAPFWKLALGYVDEPPPEPFASRHDWLASLGEPEEDWNKGAWLCDPQGNGPRLSILPVPEDKVAKNRLHIDVRLPVVGDEEERWARLRAFVDSLVDAGGRVLGAFPPHHVVMADPEGNEFCVAFSGVDGGRGGDDRTDPPA